MAFEPFVERALIDVNTASDFDQDGIKTIAVRMINPPPKRTLGHKRRLLGELLHCPKVGIVHRPSSMGKEKAKKRKIGLTAA